MQVKLIRSKEIAPKDDGIHDKIEEMWKFVYSFTPESIGTPTTPTQSPWKTVWAATRWKRRALKGNNRWKTIRLFISSTFRDMHAEREILIKQVVPEFRAFCERRRLRVEPVDFRWGIPAGMDGTTILETCMGELDRCYRENGMPFFVGLLGERYGWIPDASSFATSLALHRVGWVEGFSVTAMEMVHGAFRSNNPNAIFMIREMENKEKGGEEFNDRDVVAKEHLKELKRRLFCRFPNQTFAYDCILGKVDDHGKRQVHGLEHFAERVLAHLVGCVQRSYPDRKNTIHSSLHMLSGKQLPPDFVAKWREEKELANEEIDCTMERFLESMEGQIVGRDEEVKDIISYVQSEGQQPPLFVLGEEGQGTTCVMAKAIHQLQHKVLYHFAGLGRGDPTLAFLSRLVRLMGGLEGPLEQMCDTFVSLLEREEKQVVIFVDEIDRFDVKWVRFIPNILKANVRMVLSLCEVDRTPMAQALLERETVKQVMIPPLLDRNVQEVILSRALGSKRLDQRQKEMILEKASAANPLWLSIGAWELKLYGIFETLNDKIQSLPGGLEDLIVHVIGRLTQEMPLVKSLLCLIECSRSGLLELELRSMLGDGEPLSHTVWTPLLHAIHPFCPGEGGVLYFYHRMVSQAVCKMYLEKERAVWHEKLAIFFEDSHDLSRVAAELPYQYQSLGNKEALEKVLLQYDAFLHLVSLQHDSLSGPSPNFDLVRLWGDCTTEGIGGRYASMVQQQERRLRAVVKSVKVWRKQDTLVQLPPSVLAEFSMVCLQAALVMYELGKYPDAVKMSEMAKSFAQDEDGKARALFVLGNSLERRGESDQAFEVKKKLLVVREALLDAHPDPMTKIEVSRVLNTLACSAYAKRDFDQASTLWERALELCTFKDSNMAGEYMAGVISVNLGAYNRRVHRVDAALEYYRQGLRLYGRTIGSQHPRVVLILNNMTIAHRATGNFEEARAIAQRALSLSRLRFGEQHPSIGTSLHRLSWINRRLYLLKESLKQNMEALAIFEAVEHENPGLNLIKAHIYVALDQIELGIAESNSKKHMDCAVHHLEIALSISKTRSALSNVNSVDSAWNAACHTSLGRVCWKWHPEKAQKSFEKIAPRYAKEFVHFWKEGEDVDIAQKYQEGLEDYKVGTDTKESAAVSWGGILRSMGGVAWSKDEKEEAKKLWTLSAVAFERGCDEQSLAIVEAIKRGDPEDATMWKTVHDCIGK